LSQPPTHETDLRFERRDLFDRLIGPEDANLSALEAAIGVTIDAASDDGGGRLRVSGPSHDVEAAALLLQEMYLQVKRGRDVHPEDVTRVSARAGRGGGRKLEKLFDDTVGIRVQKRNITPKSRNQKRYLELMRSHDVVFGVGPAGTGKTYLAMAVAIATFQAHGCKRIVLARPAVEAGERLGFLPGDLIEKVNPYLRPLYDALHDLMDFRKASDLLKQGIIEVAPLAFMRGRTLNDAFVILDEAQNSTVEQMKMFLTRIGDKSRTVITGDITQVDLPPGVQSGLLHAQRILRGVRGIGFADLDRADIVRHPLVAEIVHAYELDQRQRDGGREGEERTT
jgi:phosphate starvation-inducible protein PhoH and related proteins